MKVGVFTALLQSLPLEQALDYVKEAGLDTVEIGTGGYVGNAHCNPAALLADNGKLKQFQQALESRNMEISAFSCHGNPVHPDKVFAKNCTEDMRNTILLAEKVGVQRVNLFAGCPGSSDEDKHANWITCPWPTEFSEIVAWQWKERIIPYWKEQAPFAKAHGDIKFCFEMHPGVAVYNPETLLRLRDAVGETVGCNFDPSHLFWQGIDPVAAIRQLGGVIYHTHAKDCRVDTVNTSVNGVLDTKPYADVFHRSWIFRTVGYGHGYQVWKDIISTLKMVGYDYVLSIEHEDSLMSVGEGLRKAIAFLKDVLIAEKAGAMWWA